MRPVKLLAPCADLTRNFPAIGTFTSRLPSSRSPFSALDITTTATGLLCRWDSHPLDCVDSTVGDVVQLVRTLPCRWLESYTVTAEPSYDADCSLGPDFRSRSRDSRSIRSTSPNDAGTRSPPG